ncbi:MAG: biopolymer transporter ExbD [Armatimonadetes bacterium]|nr:biopolymer transporter ExbD [Armatimonadota bacterium]
MIRTRRNKQSAMISGINITPFTDVCLVLLIIFIVTANALARESSLRLDLPRAASARTPLPTSITVAITRDQQVFLDNARVTFATLGRKLTEARTQQGVDLLVIKADEGIPYRLVVSAIDAARRVGFDQIALATRQPESSARR